MTAGDGRCAAIAANPKNSSSTHAGTISVSTRPSTTRLPIKRTRTPAVKPSITNPAITGCRSIDFSPFYLTAISSRLLSSRVSANPSLKLRCWLPQSGIQLML